jgi:hypothetical protein
LQDTKLNPFEITNETKDKIIEIFELIKKYLQKFHTKKSAKADVISTTLITKIILGIYGISPAFDSYFINGLDLYNKKWGNISGKKFTPNTFKNHKRFSEAYSQILDFYNANKKLVDRLSDKYKIPPMRIIDMYFWELGKPIKEKK